MTRDDLYKMYESDAEFITKYHIMSEHGLDACVDHNWEVIKDLEHHEYPWGYFGVDRKTDIVPMLTGFFIYPEFRGKVDFWSEVDKSMGFSVYLAATFTENIPANKFLSKRGRLLNSDKICSTYLVKRGF